MELSNATVEVDEQTYKIKIGDLVFSGMKKADEWNGFTEYKNGDDSCIMFTDKKAPVFEFMSFVGMNGPDEGVVIMASGEILKALRSKA